MESSFAFAPTAAVSRSTKDPNSALGMTNSDQEKRFASSVVAAAYLFTNVLSVAPTLAAAIDFAGSTEIVAAKSGGRMGGRSATGSRGASPSYSRASSSTPRSTSTRVIERQTTVIQQPAVVQSPVVVAPPVVAPYGYGYAPDPVGVGLSVGLSAINGISREMREQSQEREIAREREELAQARMRQAELEGRLRALEAAPAR